MNTLPLNLLSDELEDNGSDDEIDDLFCQLEQIEPPPTLVETIMASVTMLSHTLSAVPQLPEEEKGLVVRTDQSIPS